MDFLKVLLLVTSLAYSSFAACTLEEQPFRQCRHEDKRVITVGQSTFTSINHKYYGVGETWMTGDCNNCSCSGLSYKLYMMCYLPPQHDLPTPKEPKEYFYTLQYTFPGSCPLGMRQTNTKTGIAAQMFLTYQRVESVSISCCTTTAVTSLPDDCMVLLKEDGCSYDVVKRSDMMTPCDGPVSAVG